MSTMAVIERKVKCINRVLTKTTYIIKAAQLTIHDCLFKLFMKKSLQQESSIYETSRDQ